MSVTIVGTVALDSIKTPYGIKEKILGGAATFAGTAASIYSPTNLISVVGQDFPQAYLNFFKERKINIEGIEIAEGKTFHWSGYYEKEMNQAHTIQTDLNVLLGFDPQVPEKFKGGEFVYLGNIDPILQRKVCQQFKKPKLVVLDTMNYWIRETYKELLETLKLIDVLIINDQELRMLTGIDNIIEAMPKAVALGPKTLIIKKGEHGAIMYHNGSYSIFPAYPLARLVDPTGAGDSFAGAFIGYMAKQKEISLENFQKAIIAGTIISSFTVQGFSLDILKTIDQNKIQERFSEIKQFSTLPETI